MRRPPDARVSTAVDPADRGRTFTLELRRPCAPDLCGRLTHVASGESAHFTTADELVTLLRDYGRDGHGSGA